jgi:hypothetical protein
MELKEFISKTLTEIQEGISEANKSGLEISDNTAKEIEFDISVTTNSTDESKLGAGIFVTGLGIGANSKETNNNLAVNRIRFSLPLFIKNNN